MGNFPHKGKSSKNFEIDETKVKPCKFHDHLSIGLAVSSNYTYVVPKKSQMFLYKNTKLVDPYDQRGSLVTNYKISERSFIAKGTWFLDFTSWSSVQQKNILLQICFDLSNLSPECLRTAGLTLGRFVKPFGLPNSSLRHFRDSKKLLCAQKNAVFVSNCTGTLV